MPTQVEHVNISLPIGLADEAKALGINISGLVSIALKQAIKSQDNISSYNKEYIQSVYGRRGARMKEGKKHGS